MRLATAFLLTTLSLAAQSPTDQTIRRLDGSHIGSSAASALAERILKENKVTGAEIAVLNDGHMVWISGFGLRDKQNNLPMTPVTTTWAASITKGVFAVYVMTLVEQHRLDLDRPIVQLLDKPLDSYPDYKQTAGDLVRDQRWSAVTPRMLLSHTSGLANFASLEPDKKMHLHYAPGSRFAYSGEGLNLLQFVIEQREHQPLEELMQKTIFTPLEMRYTSMVWNEVLASNVADRYDANSNFISHTRRDHARAAGSMTTAATDLARLAAALTNDGRKAQGPVGSDSTLSIVHASSLETLFTPAIRIDTKHQFPTFDETKSSEGPSVGLAYGLGWGLLTKTKYGPAFFKEGHGDGAQNYMICFTKHRDCMIILTNSDNGELAFKPLLEGVLGDTVTPWEWEGYTREGILASRQHQ